MIRRRTTERVILHCSATSPSQQVTIDDIKDWHLKRGWDDIGYHFVIDRKGNVDRGRNIHMQGAHTFGQNHDSIGICYIGGVDAKNISQNNITEKQKTAVENLVTCLRVVYGHLSLHGHREFSNKACPSFDVAEIFPEL